VRDPARIDRILESVRQVWTKYPDLRLGQLIVNAIRPSRPCPQVFYAEDTVIENGLTTPPGERPPYEAGELTLELSLNEAIVLFEFVARFSQDDKPLTIEEPAESQVLHNVCARLEKQLPEPFSKEWPLILEQARTALNSRSINTEE
jgi:hypothetical protein